MFSKREKSLAPAGIRTSDSSVRGVVAIPTIPPRLRGIFSKVLPRWAQNHTSASYKRLRYFCLFLNQNLSISNKFTKTIKYQISRKIRSANREFLTAARQTGTTKITDVFKTFLCYRESKIILLVYSSHNTVMTST